MRSWSEMICAIRRQNSGAVSILLAGELLTGGDVPQAELRMHDRRSAIMRPVTRSLRVDAFPARKLRRGVDIDDFLNDSRIDRREQAGALEVVGDDLGHADADFAVGRRTRHEIWNRDRQRRDIALGDVEPRLRPRKSRQQQAGSRAADQGFAAAQRQRRKTERRHGHCKLISRNINHETSRVDRR